MYGREKSCSRPLQKLQKNRTLHRLSRNNPSLVNPIIFTLSRKSNKLEDDLVLPIVDVNLFSGAASAFGSSAPSAFSLSPLSSLKEVDEFDSIFDKDGGTTKKETVPESPNVAIEKKKKAAKFILPDGVVDFSETKQGPVGPGPSKRLLLEAAKKKTGCGGVLTRSKRWEIPPKKKKERFHASDLHKQIWEKHVKHKEEQKKFGFTPKSSCGCG
jgi:hypothetical protein